MTSASKQPHCGPAYSEKRAADLSLPVLSGHPAAIRKSKSGPRRAIVLAIINVLMAIHLIQWLVQGMTISPVEPSESMYTLELGQVNAGFIFFCAALLATFIFGRFFCGWGCHVIALQDACTWMMEKCGVRPRPFRSRLLMLGPLLLGGYMFFWPTFKREALLPLLDHWKIVPPIWLERPADFPGWTNHLVTADFWATFPPWYVAIPFLLVCGFLVVYVLGSKGFCTYGCPYGGLFAPVDKISIGRIVVSDACEGCGHCTAVCSSNVRVHQEVRDFGMVVDPGCMKCLDCVSVCPNDALSFSFAKPAVLAKPRTPEAKAGTSRKPRYDLSWPQELFLFAVAVGLFCGFRGMWDMVPLLMAAGLAAIGAFGVWKIWQLVSVPNARLQSLQLKVKGRWTVWGAAFALLAAGYVALGGWGGFINYHRWRGDLADLRVNVPLRVVFSHDYQPQPAMKAAALDAIEHYRISGSPGEGGYGWRHQPKTAVRIGWLYAVAGDLPNAEIAMRDAIDRGDPNSEMVFGLSQIMELQGKSAEQGKAMFDEVLAKHPELYDVRLTVGIMLLHAGRGDEALLHAEAVIRGGKVKPNPAQFCRAVMILTDAGKPGEAIKALEDAIKAEPKEPEYHFALGQLLCLHGEFDRGLAGIRESIRLEPENLIRLSMHARILRDLGRTEEAVAVEKRIAEVEAKRRTPSPK